MKNITNLFFLVPCIIALGIGLTACGRSAEVAFHHNGELTEQVKAIFKELGVTVTSLAQANEFAQKNLLRTGERWDKQEDNQLHTTMKEKQTALIDDLRALGMVDEIKPTKKEYTYALLMGATTARVKQRLVYLASLIGAGYHFEYIVLLGGERQLREVEKEGLPETITTEAQMMAYLCAQDEQCKDKQSLLVNAPMIQKPDGTVTRPTTDTTLQYFAEIAPHDGSCLVISNNPYAVRQAKVTQRILDQSRFPTESAGQALNINEVGIIMAMDEFARTIYEENLRFAENK